MYRTMHGTAVNQKFLISNLAFSLVHLTSRTSKSAYVFFYCSFYKESFYSIIVTGSAFQNFSLTYLQLQQYDFPHM